MARAAKRATRTAPSADREVMRLVAELYYARDLRQPEIAEMTGFSVSKVSRILAQAREVGMFNKGLFQLRFGDLMRVGEQVVNG